MSLEKTDPRARRFFDGIRGKHIALCGVGVSNRPLVDLFLQKGAFVTVCDRKERPGFGGLPEELEKLGAEVRFGPDYLDHLAADIVFRAPGMYFLSPEITQLREQGLIVTSEMEVFFDLCPAKIYGVTGSDGKTTTTTLIAEMLRAAGKTVHLGGNIGRALLPEIENIRPDDFAVVELSSFQLISMRKSPDVAVITNVAPNHLDVHRDMEEYIDAKRNLYEHQNAFSRTVLNADNAITAGFAPEVRGNCLFFSRRQPVNGVYLREDGMICAKAGEETQPILPANEIRIPGDHNVENMMAAMAALWGEVSPEIMGRVAREFGGVEHRIEFVRELDGVKWYNDSIATSPTRTMAGLRSFHQKVILLAGGYDKHIPFTPLAPLVNEKVKLLILTGPTADLIETAVTSDPDYDPAALTILRAANLAEAVETARGRAAPGDIVTLSPACASFDAYPNFEARGDHYKSMVNGFTSRR